MQTTDRQALLAAAAEAIGVDVWTWDAARRVCTRVADGAASEAPLALEDWVDTFDFAERDRARDWLLARGLATSRRELEVRDARGVRLRLVEVRADNSHFVIAQKPANKDVDAVRRAHQDFLYAVSHDLQEPLRTIVSYLSLIESRSTNDLPSEAREHFAVVQGAAERLKSMFHALLEQSRVETQGGAFETIHLDRLIAEVRAGLELSIEESGARFDVAELPVVRGDEKQLHRAFHELLDNAIKFHGDEAPEIRIRAARARDLEEITVSSRGIAMRADDETRAFRPFGQLQARDAFPGLGTGLPLARRIAERHGGRLDFHTEGDGWNHFVLRLPVS